SATLVAFQPTPPSLDPCPVRACPVPHKRKRRRRPGQPVSQAATAEHCSRRGLLSRHKKTERHSTEHRRAPPVRVGGTGKMFAGTRSVPWLKRPFYRLGLSDLPLSL